MKLRVSTHALVNCSVALGLCGALVGCGANAENASSNSADVEAGSPGDPNLLFVGRVDPGNPESPAFQWSGTGVVANFEGSSLAVSLDDNGNHFSVLLDGTHLGPLVTEPGIGRYELADNLPPGSHRVEVYRRTEALFGPTRLLGFDFGIDARTLPTAPLDRQIEIIGDSVSTAYGILGTSTACGFSAETQDHFQSYVSLSARALNAEVSTVAWSGKGVIYNYDQDVIDPMPALYDRILPEDAESLWSYALAMDAVVINLGTNDFSTDDDPSPELFSGEYLKLLERVRSHYPTAHVLCTVGPMLNGQDLLAAQTGIRSAVAQFEAGGGDKVSIWEMTTLNSSPGCDYHPSVPTHVAMAEELTQQLQTALGW